MPFPVGQWELIVLGVLIALIFGSKKLPGMARDLGKGMRELRETVDGVDPRKQVMKALDPPKTDDAARATSTPPPADPPA